VSEVVTRQAATAEPVSRRRAARSDVGAGFVSRGGLVGLTLLVVVLAGLLLYHLWAFWPTELGKTTAQAPPKKTVSYFGAWHIRAAPETLLFLIVALAGALGGLIHSLRSLSTYIGHRQLRWSWVPFNVLLPVVGALGGTVFYLVLRGGLFSPSTSANQANPFGFAAVAVLVGLFSEQAMEKLRELADNLFTRVASGEDHFTEDQPQAGKQGAEDQQ
jgi:hypothetical protein